VPRVCDESHTRPLTWGVRESLLFVIIKYTTLNMVVYGECDSSQTRGTHVDHHVKGCIFDYHKHEALTYTPCLGLCM
jgi:hypothetical protein